MATGTWVEVEHRDRGHLVLELELADWVGWESWAGRSFVTFGDENNPPGIKDVAYLAYEAAKRTGVHDGDSAVVEPDAHRLPAVPAGHHPGPYPAGSFGRRRVDVALATGTAPDDWNDLADLLTAEEAAAGGPQEALRCPPRPPRTKAGRVTVRLDDREIQAILRAFSKMDKQANKDLKELSRDISEDLVGEFRNAARGTRWYPEQASFVAQSARVARDRTPSVTLGGAQAVHDRRRPARRRRQSCCSCPSSAATAPSSAARSATRRSVAPASRAACRDRHGRPREGRGNRGWWLFPRLKRLQPNILRRWIEGAQKVADTWGKP